MSLGYDRNLYMLVGGETDAESAARTIAGNYGRMAEAYEAAAIAAGASR